MYQMMNCKISGLSVQDHTQSYIEGINYIDGFQYGDQGPFKSLSYKNGTYFVDDEPLDLTLLHQDRPEPTSKSIQTTSHVAPMAPLTPLAPLASLSHVEPQPQCDQKTYECWRTVRKRIHPDGRIEYNIKERLSGVSHTDSEYSFMKIKGVWRHNGTVDYDVKERIPN